MLEQIISRWKEANPDACHGYGLHEYDGILPDLTDVAINKRIAELKSDITYIKEQTSNDKITQFEFQLLENTLTYELFQLETEQAYLSDPLYWISGRTWSGTIGAVETSYTVKNYASIETRTRSIIKLEDQIPSFLALAKKRLSERNNPLSKPKLSMGLSILRGQLSFFEDQLISFIIKVDDEDLINKWSESNIKALEAMREFEKFLVDALKVATDDFALGEEKFRAKLKYSEGVDLSADELLKHGQAELDRNYKMMLEIAERRTDGDVQKLIEQVQKLQTEPDKLLEYVSQSNDQVRQFIIENDLVSIPTDEQCEVIPTPKSMRNFAFAAMNTPGPFDPPEASKAYYWVTPVEPDWDERRTQDHLKFMNKAFIQNVTAHEAWPGHFLQLLWSNKSKSDIIKMFSSSYSMVEGWGLYCEQLVYNAGYAPMDRDLYHVGQLIGALARAVRFISAVSMHCKGMTVEDSQQLFVEKAFLTPSAAFVEANRGTVDPMYLNYTLGKLLILKLQEDYKVEKGEKYTLKKFNDELLQWGSPPITILRNIVLEDNSGSIL